MSNRHIRLLPSRLITIFDVKIELKWSGKTPDGTEADGKLVIPEVSHEATLDGLSEYTVRFPIRPPHDPRYASHDPVHRKVRMDSFNKIIQICRRPLPIC